MFFTNRGNDAWRLLQLQDHFKSYLEFQPNLRPISPLLLPHRMQNFLRASFEFDVALGKRNLARWEINTCHATGHLARDLAFVHICKPVSFEIQLCLQTG
ncbi:uncharacterized protein LOC123192450 isoform X4 [Mangifera indica]|uniref:uncharacterized protein LOC123192450 isoform X4 n=1 Tax=Mangifera indica TaxID=29780 RepID=UPI001CFB3566|nr:uncharacterized protein LOC123192450 isoform X4 [Mangifera indica]